MAEGKTEEHSLEYQELFNEYLLIFEGKLEDFIGKAKHQLPLTLLALQVPVLADIITLQNKIAP